MFDSTWRPGSETGEHPVTASGRRVKFPTLAVRLYTGISAGVLGTLLPVHVDAKPRSDVGLYHAVHMAHRRSMLRLVAGSDAVFGNNQFQIAHIGIMCRE